MTEAPAGQEPNNTEEDGHEDDSGDRYAQLQEQVSQLSEKLEGFAKKTNKELKQRRLENKGVMPTDTPPANGTPKAPDEVEALRAKVARLELAALAKGIPENIRKQLEERHADDPSALLSSFEALQGVSFGAAPGEGEKPAVKPGRGAPPATPNAVSHPRTLAEYARLAKSNPKKKAQLDADPNFDPMDLPPRLPRS